MGYVLIEVGATTSRIAYTKDARSYGQVQSCKTKLVYRDALATMEALANELISDSVEGVVLGVRGQLDDQKQSIIHDSILTDWIDRPLADDVSALFNTPTYLENNAALAALGEATYGAGAGHDIVVYHSLSTGVGGAKIESGSIDANRGSFEPGQQILDIDHTILGEDIEPTLENLVSGRAVAERMGMPAYEIDQTDAIWDQLAYFLAHGLRNSILYWSPDVLVLGGPMMLGTPHIDIDTVIDYTNEVVGEVTEVPLIVRGSFTDEVGLQGALARVNKL